jgi:hypothetical protein
MSGVGLEVVTVPEGRVLYTVLLFHHFTSVIVMSGHLHQFIHCALKGHSMFNVFSIKITAIQSSVCTHTVSC